MDSSGLIGFGAEERVFDDVPPPYQQAVRHVEEQFDREAFYDAVDDPSSYVFFGVAPARVGIDYDWPRVPPFLGWALWTDDKDRFVPIDTAERIFDRLGLHPVNTFEKEVNVRDFHPERYTIPDSAWYDGPAVAVLVENRRGGHAVLENPAIERTDDSEPIYGDPSEVVPSLVTAERIERASEAIETRGKAVTTDEVRSRVFEMIASEEFDRLDAGSIDWRTLRSEIGSVVAERLGETAGH
ncbi:hypothetical protein [Haloferax sp. DFSO52]|uniref:hypothetical protein n=1 Tax=Haloferax sp. DFSO52 TaxID=3388505 RepID=UPI003A8A64B4